MGRLLKRNDAFDRHPLCFRLSIVDSVGLID